MGSKRESKPVAKVNLSQSEIDSLLQAYATSDAELEKLSAKMDLEKLKITDKYKDQLADHLEKKSEAYAQLKAYYEANRKEIFTTKKKSLDTLFGKIGFKIGNHAVEKQKGFTWKAVEKLVKEFLPSYIRTKEEINKEDLISDRELHFPDEMCSEEMKKLPEEQRPLISSLYEKCGIEIIQPENFFIELKKEEVTA